MNLTPTKTPAIEQIESPYIRRVLKPVVESIGESKSPKNFKKVP